MSVALKFHQRRFSYTGKRPLQKSPARQNEKRIIQGSITEDKYTTAPLYLRSMAHHRGGKGNKYHSNIYNLYMYDRETPQ